MISSVRYEDAIAEDRYMAAVLESTLEECELDCGHEVCEFVPDDRAFDEDSCELQLGEFGDWS